MFDPSFFGPKKKLGLTKFGLQKEFYQKKFRFNKCWGPKKFGSNKMLVQAPKILAQKNLDKIGSVTAEIFLIWTNIAGTNIAWINVTMTVGIC